MEAPIRALIFDFDGLILDTETAIYEGWREIYEVHGHPLLVETWAQCVGSDFGHYNPADDLERLLGVQVAWEPLHERRRHFVRQRLEGQQPFPGVRERLEEALGLGIPCAVASSSSREWVQGWVERLGLDHFFQNVTTLDDTGRVKPDPSLFLHAAGKLGVPPGESLVFEDSLNGLRAAHAAGMRCVIVPCMITSHLEFPNAWRKINSLEDVTLQELLAAK